MTSNFSLWIMKKRILFSSIPSSGLLDFRLLRRCLYHNFLFILPMITPTFLSAKSNIKIYLNWRSFTSFTSTIQNDVWNSPYWTVPCDSRKPVNQSKNLSRKIIYLKITLISLKVFSFQQKTKQPKFFILEFQNAFFERKRTRFQYVKTPFRNPPYHNRVFFWTGSVKLSWSPKICLIESDSD